MEVEYVGDWGDFVGMDGFYDDDIGARRRRGIRRWRRGGRVGPRPGIRFRRKNPTAMVKPARPVARHTLDPSNARRQPLGLPVTTVPAATAPTAPGVADIQVNVQREFQGERLVLQAVDVLTGGIANATVVSQFLIASVNQLPSGQPLPVSAFVPNAFDTFLELTPATVGALYQLQFQNFNTAVGGDAVVSGAVFGMTRTA